MTLKHNFQEGLVYVPKYYLRKPRKSETLLYRKISSGVQG